MLIFGAKTESERVGRVDIACSQCGARPCMLFVSTTRGTLYFVSVANLKRTYQVTCGKCDSHWEIDTELGERLHRHLKPETVDTDKKSLPDTAQGVLQSVRKAAEIEHTVQALPNAARGLLQNLRNKIDPTPDTEASPAPATLSSAEASAALAQAAADGDMKQVKALLKRGADVNGYDKSGWTPLVRAADAGQLEVVRFLLERGADVTRPSRNGFTPLMRAFINGHSGVVDLLRQSGAKS